MACFVWQIITFVGQAVEIRTEANVSAEVVGLALKATLPVSSSISLFLRNLQRILLIPKFADFLGVQQLGFAHFGRVTALLLQMFEVS